MKPTLFVVTTALVAMPWLAGAQDGGRRPTPTTAIAANNPVIAPDPLRPLGSRLAQAGPQPPDSDSATRRVRTIILRSDARTKDEPPQSDRPPAEGPHNERRAEIPSSRPPSQFRQIYFCDQKDPASASALGEITGWKTVTVVGPGGKSAAAVKEILPEEMFLAGTFRGTRLELAPGAPCSAAALTILAPAETVEVVPVEETKDASAITRVADYLELRSRDGIPAADEQPDVYLTNYRVTDAKVFALPPNYTAVLAHVTHDAMVRDVIHQKYEKSADPNEAEPMLFIVGKGVSELTMGSRQESSICDSLVSAFKISDRLHIHVSSNGCANGIKGEMVFDLSGPGPKAIFSDWDLSD